MREMNKEENEKRISSYLKRKAIHLLISYYSCLYYTA